MLGEGTPYQFWETKSTSSALLGQTGAAQQLERARGWGPREGPGALHSNLQGSVSLHQLLLPMQADTPQKETQRATPRSANSASFF